MEQRIAEFVEDLKDESSLIVIEEKLFILIWALVCESLGVYLEHLDDRLFVQSEAKCLRKDQRTVITMFGAVTFKRRLVEKPDGSHGYLLDEKLGLVKRQRYSPLVLAIVSQLASKAPYRTIASAISLLTPFSVSHQMIAKFVKHTGEELDTVKTAETNFPEEAPDLRQVPVLYLEGDAFEIRTKHGQRQMVHRFQAFEGVAYHGKRHTLINRYQVALTNRHQAMRELAAYLANHYDLRSTLVITSSDNGSGYEPEVFNELAVGAARHVHILDRYHMARKLKARLPDQPDMVKLLKDALYRGDRDRMEMILDTAESRILIDDTNAYQEAFSAVTKLRRYLERNWDYIAPLSDPSLQGQLSGLGSCESNHRKFTYRLKHQGKSWSKAGLSSMLRIIAAEQNGDYEANLIKAGLLDHDIKPEPIKGQQRNNNRELFRQDPTVHIGVKRGRISLNDSSSSAMGHLVHLLG